MRDSQRKKPTPVFLLIILGGLIAPGVQTVLGQSPQEAQPPPQTGSSTEDLQKQTQNPIANLVSVPFQSNTDYNAGPFARDKTALNIQPVFPKPLGQSVILIPRIIIPIIFQPDLTQQQFGTFGLGDLQPTFFLAPAGRGKLIWGAGPALLLPTATNHNLGAGKWCAGPAIVALVQPGKWTIGTLVSNLTSFAGSSSRADINTMSLQYFVNYNLEKGWFLTSAPILTANWNAPSRNIWVVPFGGGAGRIFKVGFQPMNGSVSLYYNAVRPQNLPFPTWTLRMQLALLFPRAPKR